MRFSTIVGIFTVMLTLVPGLVFAEHVIDDSKKPGYLFVLSAASGSLKGDTLTLNGVPNVIYFSDRPARKAGHMSLSEFIEMWDKGVDNFKADPPNATLSVLKKDGAKNVVVELMSVEKKNGSVVFKVAVLEGMSPESFKMSSLFLDGFPFGPGA
ncbi:hypothetical protein MYX76_13100 [Desulfobacterota bacterium AH_259_B03_O07]|nr:hypothetical protein [Desulfobacterota bacterium AH_259_B03_O07]